MPETRKVDNNMMCKVLFVSLHPLYITVMRYLEECFGNGRVIIKFSGK